MAKEINLDWYNKLKVDLIKVAVVSEIIRSDIIYLIQTNPNVIYDINLEERLTYLIESMNSNYDNINNFKQRIDILDTLGFSFSKDDLLDEFSYIKNITELEIVYYIKIIDYLAMVDDYTIEGNGIVEFLEANDNDSNKCYESIKSNDKDLKKLLKERRDNFE